MKNRIIVLFFLALTISACKKDQPKLPVSQNQVRETITIEQAKLWLDSQTANTVIKKYPIRWQTAKNIATDIGNRVIIPLPGQPTYQNFKQGYRQLSIERNPETQKIEGKFLEVIPDALYFQGKKKVESRDFTGRILEYDFEYQLEKGTIYSGGRIAGETRPANTNEKQAFAQMGSQVLFSQQPTAGSKGKISMMAQIIESCSWVTSTYIDSEGIFTIHADRYCSYSFSGGYNDSGINYEMRNEVNDGGGGGGGGSTSNDPAPPPPSNLPGEQNKNIDPKKIVECFGNIADPNAAYQVKVLVVEPFPGTSFNVGPNSFGHVALQLTKVSGNQTITQVVGFYGSGSGLDKLVSSSTIKDNGLIDYNMSASYFTNAQDFQKILNYVASPPTQYHYTEFNCAAFVYQATRAGNLPVPDPTTTFGIGGPGGVGVGMSPAGMASALRTEKANNPKANIGEGGGVAPSSKGECK